jgi:hypothetical protein
LAESKHLEEYRSCLLDGKVGLTTVSKKSLKMILYEYGLLDNGWYSTEYLYICFVPGMVTLYICILVSFQVWLTSIAKFAYYRYISVGKLHEAIIGCKWNGRNQLKLLSTLHVDVVSWVQTVACGSAVGCYVRQYCGSAPLDAKYSSWPLIRQYAGRFELDDGLFHRPCAHYQHPCESTLHSRNYP